MGGCYSDGLSGLERTGNGAGRSGRGRFRQPPDSFSRKGMTGMRILGHGVDLVEFESLRRLLSHSEADFIAESFTPAEQSRIPSSVHRLPHLAGQFAAKEAVTKAL